VKTGVSRTLGALWEGKLVWWGDRPLQAWGLLLLRTSRLQLATAARASSHGQEKEGCRLRWDGTVGPTGAPGNSHQLRRHGLCALLGEWTKAWGSPSLTGFLF